MGRAAEDAVAELLTRHGWQVVAVRLRIGHLELDVVARRGDVVAVVEVRTRGSGAWRRALTSIDRAKQRRIRLGGARLWQRRYKHDASVTRLRFDAASVTFTPEGAAVIDYVAAAF